MRFPYRCWVNVTHSLLQDGLQKDIPADPVERKRKAQDISSSRILTQDDFTKISQVQAAKEVQYTSKNGKKRKALDVETEKT